MKLVVYDYEVEITARHRLLRDKPNEYDTLAFLIYLCNLAGDACYWLQGKGFDALAEAADRVRNDIWTFTRNQGGLEAFRRGPEE